MNAAFEPSNVATAAAARERRAARLLLSAVVAELHLVDITGEDLHDRCDFASFEPALRQVVK
jgi:hypothetical protein